MIKKCPVIINSNTVSVVKFGDVSVQLPPIRDEIKDVLIRYENGRYEIVDKSVEKPKVTPVKEVTKPATKVAKPKKTTKSVKKTEKSEIGD